jgi:GNAT superfamily N-acetyltransferase
MLRIRPATAADIPAMAAIRAAESQTQQFWEQRIAGYWACTHNPQQALPERAVFIAEDAGALIGFVAGHRTRRYQCDAELEWINTAAAHRGQGIAAALLERMAAWFVEQQAFRVCVNVAPDNAPAVAFYRKHGAQPLNEFFMVWQDVRELVPDG